MKLYQVIILAVIVAFFVMLSSLGKEEATVREEMDLISELEENIESYLPRATDPTGEIVQVTLAKRLIQQEQRIELQGDWSYGQISPTSYANTLFTLKRRHRDNLARSAEYYGYHALLDSELMEVANQGVNAIFNNFNWLSGLLAPDSDSPLGAKININNLARHSTLGWSERYGLGVFPAVITCTNFHTYPEWFVKLHPDMFMLDANGEKVPLAFETAMPNREGLFMNNLTHPVVNQLKRQMAAAMVTLMKHNDNLMAWKVDGESLYFAQGGNVLSKNTVLTDYGPQAVQQFRGWLRLRYEDIEQLNYAWGTDFHSFDSVKPPTGLEIDRASLDWNTFRIWALVEYVNDQYVVFKTLDPDRYSFSWVHDVGLWGKSLLTTGLSQYAYSYVADGIHPSYILRPGRLTYGAQYYEIVSSFGKPVLTSEMSYHPRPWPAWAIRRQMYEALGLGVWGIGLCQWTPQGSGDLNWSIQGTPGEKEARDVFAEFESFDSYLEGMWPVDPDLRIFVSEPTWIFDGWLPSWEHIQRDLLMSHVPKRYVFDRQLTERSIAFPPMMVSIGNRVIHSDVHKELMNYVKEGGVLAVCGEFFTYDETMKETGWNIEEFRKTEDRQEHGARYQVYSVGEGEIIRFEGSYDASVTEALISFSRRRGICLEPVKVMDFQGYPEIEIESFLLSDGINLAVVLINVYDGGISAELSLQDCILGDSKYEVRELISQAKLRSQFGIEDKIDISLDPYGTAVLYFSRITDTDEVNALLDEVKSGWKSLTEFGITPWGKEVIQKAEQDLEDGRLDKALASINKVMDYLYVIPEKHILTVTEGMRQPLSIQVLDYKGLPVSGISIDTRITPGFDTRLLWREVDSGQYEVLIDDLMVPPIYNYSRQKYIRYQGTSWLEIDVWHDGGEGYTTVELEFI